MRRVSNATPHESNASPHESNVRRRSAPGPWRLEAIPICGTMYWGCVEIAGRSRLRVTQLLPWMRQSAPRSPTFRSSRNAGKAGDLSLNMFLILALGVTSWIVCGFLQGDLVIIIANSASLCLLLGIIYCKLREGAGGVGRSTVRQRTP